MVNLEKCYGLNQLKCYNMGKTLWTYGCSWTDWDDLSKIDPDFKFWPTIVSNELNYNLVNRGKGGISVNNTFIKLLSDLSLIKKDDVVIFEFTYPSRYNLNYLILDNPQLKWNSEIARDLNNGIVTNFDIHVIDYFKKEKFYNDEQIMLFLNFIDKFNDELLLKDYLTIINVFDYIENTIGATIKYWFLKIHHNSYADTKKEKITNTVWNEKRILSFPNGSRNIDATDFITKTKQRFKDNNDIGLKFVDGDYHPNQNGHHLIAKEIIISLSGKKSII
jgi:hypothetical protein